jgi:hypothetical protein
MTTFRSYSKNYKKNELTTHFEQISPQAHTESKLSMFDVTKKLIKSVFYLCKKIDDYDYDYYYYCLVQSVGLNLTS